MNPCFPLHPRTTLAEVVRSVVRHNARSFPVIVDDRGHACAMMTLSTLMNYLSEHKYAWRTAAELPLDRLLEDSNVVHHTTKSYVLSSLPLRAALQHIADNRLTGVLLRETHDGAPVGIVSHRDLVAVARDYISKHRRRMVTLLAIIKRVCPSIYEHRLVLQHVCDFIADLPDFMLHRMEEPARCCTQPEVLKTKVFSQGMQLQLLKGRAEISGRLSNVKPQLTVHHLVRFMAGRGLRQVIVESGSRRQHYLINQQCIAKFLLHVYEDLASELKQEDG